MSRHLLLCLLLPAAAAFAGADDLLPDPTRPSGAPGAAGVDSSPGLVLQSVILPRAGKPRAVISGQSVELGREIFGQRLVRVAEGEVVLESGAGREVLRLTPAVIKQPVRRNAAADKQRGKVSP